jgi:hypothetical protein
MTVRARIRTSEIDRAVNAAAGAVRSNGLAARCILDLENGKIEIIICDQSMIRKGDSWDDND